jgi:hypothetical protein
MANDSRPQLLRLRRFRIGITLIVCCILNILAFAANSERLGGTAILGMADRGRYFVGNHGRYTEVTASQYRRNLLHDDICLGSLPIVLLGGILTISAARSPNRVPEA